MPAFSSIGNLPGALRINYAFPTAAQEDLGGRLQLVLSNMAAMISNLTVMQSALLSANASAVTLSSLSGVTFTTYQTNSNFASV
jgi:hypothetical protein